MDTNKSKILSTSEASQKASRRREYNYFNERSRDTNLVPYEDATVIARTILDAASDEEFGSVSARLHIFILMSKRGTLSIKRERGRTICCTKTWKIASGKRCSEEGEESIEDSLGEVYEAAISAHEYVKALIREFGKNSKDV